MFRWLKDRTKRGRKTSADTSPEVDDYGFKQKYSPPPKAMPAVQEPFLAFSVAGAAGWEDYKRELPPTPADITASCIVMDDDIRSVHIYEEIPDLPFRCTPEGELRFGLAREEALRRLGFSPRNEHFNPASFPSHSAACGSTRNISPYMVVPLRQGGATPEEFRMISRQTEHFGHVIGPDDDGGRGSVCLTPSMATSSPSCGSSVFGSPLGLLGQARAEDCRGDISDRLLSAINLTRLLAAIRLSSSSADTCTTSPITIGMDHDGRNISVSVSVTPTNHPQHNHVNAGGSGQGNSASVIIHDQRLPVDGSAVCETDTSMADSSAVATSALCPKSQPWLATGSRLQQTGFVARRNSSCVAQCEVALNSASTSKQTEVALNSASTSKQTEATKSDLASTSTDNPTTEMFQKSGFVSQRHFTHTGLRFLSSPQEQSALSEILHLKPGESAELDPPTIDALILRLCSHTLQIQPAQIGGAGATASLQRAELEAVEKMLKEMVRASEAEMEEPEEVHQDGAFQGPQLSPGTRRAENSDTGYEYDVSTASSEVSDQTSYDYFLSKAARTRSLECEVKKLITESCCSDSDVGVDDVGVDDGLTLRAPQRGHDRKENRVAAAGGMSSLSLFSTTAPSLSAFTRHPSTLRLLRSLSASDVIPTRVTNTTTDVIPTRVTNTTTDVVPTRVSNTTTDVVPTRVSNTTIAAGPSAAVNISSTLADSDDGTMADLSESENSSGYYEPLPPTRAPRAPPLSSSSSSTCTTRGRRVKETVMGVGGLQQRAGGAGAGQGKEPLDVLDVPCFELRCTCPQADRSLHAAGCRLAAVAAYTPRRKKSRRHDHPRNHHRHHPHRKNRRKQQDLNSGTGTAEVQHQGRCVSLKVRSSSGDRLSLPLTPAAVSGCRRASADAAYSGLSLNKRPSSSSGSSLTHGGRLFANGKDHSMSSSTSSSCLYDKATAAGVAVTVPSTPATRSGSGKGGWRNRLLAMSPAGNGYKSRGARLSLSASCKTSQAAGATSSQDAERADVGGQDSTYSPPRDSEVYSIPVALPPDHPAGPRGCKASGTVPTKLSLVRGSVPDSSEVYGTRASLLQSSGSRPVSNRLLNDVIMANYNNM